MLQAAAAACVVFLAGWWFDLFPARTVAHVADVYHLTYVPRSGGASAGLVLEIATGADPATPTRADVYQNDSLFRSAVSTSDPNREPIPISASGDGRYYQVRATLPMGNLALSNAVWVPSEDVVTVFIDAWPWASVTISGAGSTFPNQVTPFFSDSMATSWQRSFKRSVGICGPINSG